MLGHIFLLGLLQIGLAVFQMSGFFRTQAAVVDAFGDALLLAGFAAVDLIDARMSGIFDARTRIGGGGLSSRASDHKSAQCQGH